MSIEVIKVDQAITNCTVKNQKNQSCAGHLKEYMTAPAALQHQLPAGYRLYRCKRCQTLYQMPAQQHLKTGHHNDRLPPAEFP